tara:strand:+ start:290 stop:2056 length:1767 start_codon:yes stop_codon:yes gene_type:complete
MMDKAVIGLIASLGIIGAVVTKNSNKVKDAESFMADMRGRRQPYQQGMPPPHSGIGVRKIPRNKLNFSAFEKDLPAIITKSNINNWDNLASLNWLEINEISKGGSDDHYPEQTYRKLNALAKGGPYPPNSVTAYSNLANTIQTLSARYSREQENSILTPSFKKAMTAFKKLNANLEKGMKDYKNQRYLRLDDMPKVAKYVAFKNLMENVADGAEKIAKLRGGNFDRKAFDDFMKSCGEGQATGQNYTLRNQVLRGLDNFSQYLNNSRASQYEMSVYRQLVLYFVSGLNYSKEHGTMDADVAFQDPSRVAYVLFSLPPHQIALLYQYGMFFNDNPTIQFLGAKTRPYNKMEEMYFSKFARRDNMELYRVLPKELRIDRKRYVDILRNRSRGLMSQVSRIENEADTLTKIKEDARIKNVENATKTIIEQVQTALDGGLVAGRFGRSFNTMPNDKSELSQEQKVDLALSIIENPDRNMTALLIYPSKIIDYSYGVIDENGMPVMETDTMNLMQNTNLLRQVMAEEVLKGLTLNPAMKGEMQKVLNARLQQAIELNDRQIAQLAKQMTRYIDGKDQAQKDFQKGMNLVDFAF